MKDSFIQQGKKYISAKRASEISDYSADYIGQLCRAGKLDCQRVGHSWFVTRESMVSHQAKVVQDDLARNRIENLKGKKGEVRTAFKLLLESPAVIEQRAEEADSASDEANGTIIDGKKFISAKYASKISEYSADYVGQLCRSGKMDCRMIGRSWFVSEVSLQSHIKNVAGAIDKDLNQTTATVQPEVVVTENSSVAQTSSVNSAQPVSSSPVVQPQQTLMTASEAVAYAELSRSIMMRRFLTTALVLCLVIGLSVTGYLAFDRSQGILAENTVSNTQSIISSANTEASAVSSQNASEGIAVAPSAGNTPSDTAMKQKIQNSFSDQVDVKADQSGTAGVITPVFRETKSKDFIYVMVPVNAKDKTSQSSSVTPNTGSSPP